MSHEQDRSETDRRSFLKLAGLSTVTGGAALVAQGKPADAADAPDGAGGAGYRETAHVRKVYETARF